MRPVELAQDNTPHLPVMQHAVSWLKENENYNPNLVAILQPTCHCAKLGILKKLLSCCLKKQIQLWL